MDFTLLALVLKFAFQLKYGVGVLLVNRSID